MKIIKHPAFRIISAIIMIASIILGYWWLTWSLSVIFLFIFENYYEIIVWGIIYDAVYGISYSFTIVCLIAFVSAHYLRKYLIAYT